MTKVVLSDTQSGFNLSKINENFDKIEEALNDKVLYRDNPDGEVNQMENVLDMNNNRIINLPAPSNPNDAARLVDIPFEPVPIGTTTALLTTFAPAGSISSVNVQAAIEELSNETTASLNTLTTNVAQMLGTTTYTRYVSTSGSDSNDGTALSPYKSLQKAFNELMALGVVGGTREIVLGAGTWSGTEKSARLGPANENETIDPDTDPYKSNGVVLVNYLVIRGADVGYDPDTNPEPVPTTIFDGGNTASVAIQIEGPLKVLVKDIKFQNYNGSSSSGGVIGDGADIRCENVHGDNNYYTISGSRGRLEVKGGRIKNDTGGSGIRSIFNNKHEIGNQLAGAVGQGPFIENCTIGLYVQEGATGHADYSSFIGCDEGIYATVNSRVNYTGTLFDTCGRGWTAQDSYMFAQAGSATFMNCTENKVKQMGAIDAPRDNYGNSGLASDFINSAVVHTGTVNSTPILSKTLTKGDFAPNVTSTRKPQMIKGKAFGTMSGTAGSKQFKIRLGSTLLATVTNASSDTGSWTCDFVVVFLDSNVQTANIEWKGHTATIRTNTDTGTEDLAAADATLSFEVQLSNAADTVTVNHVHFETWG